MIPENFKTLVDKLKAKTTKKEAIWSKTSRNDEFKLDLGKGAITVDSWQSEDTAEQLVDIAVINERGDRVDSIYFSSSEKEDYKYLIELHTLAKRAYYKVDETFKTIFKELDSEKTIGTERKTEDDLPF
jgi:hypothetical protein